MNRVRKCLGRMLHSCGYINKQRVQAQTGLTNDNINGMTRKAQSYYSNNMSSCVYICSDIPREPTQSQSDKDIPEYRS